MPNQQYYSAGCAFKGELWVVGGKHATRELSTAVAIYDPATDVWREGPELPESRFYHALVEHAGRLVVFGGAAGSDATLAAAEGLRPPLVLSEAGSSWVRDDGVCPPLPLGFEHPLLAAMVASAPVG